MISFDQVFGLKPNVTTYTDSDEALFEITQRNGLLRFKHTKGFEKLIKDNPQDNTFDDMRADIEGKYDLINELLDALKKCVDDFDDRSKTMLEAIANANQLIVRIEGTTDAG